LKNGESRIFHHTTNTYKFGENDFALDILPDILKETKKAIKSSNEDLIDELKDVIGTKYSYRSLSDVIKEGTENIVEEHSKKIIKEIQRTTGIGSYEYNNLSQKIDDIK